MRKLMYATVIAIAVAAPVSIAPKPADAYVKETVRLIWNAIKPTRLGPERGSMGWCVEMGDCGHLYHGIFVGVH